MPDTPAPLRAFLAVELPASARDAIAAPLASLQHCAQTAGVEARWSRPEGWHLTLKFLGWVASDRVEAIGTHTARIASGASPMGLQLVGFGAFPSAQRARVLWAGVKEDAGRVALTMLAGRIEQAMALLGFPPEERPFSPHLTLARIDRPRLAPALAQWLREHQDDALGAVRVERIALMKSERQGGESIYTPIREFSLGG